MEKSQFRKRDIFILGLVLAVALGLRLYRINAPLSDFHSWRQADTAAVARNFVREGFNLFKPHYDDLSSIQSGRENPEGLRFVEFPLYNAMFAGLYKVLPILPVEVYGRIISIVFSLTTAAILYYLALKEYNRLAAFFSSLIYAILPASVFFSRTVLPETTALGFVFISIFLLYSHKSSRNNFIFGVLSALCFACAILIKPTVIFFGLPLLYLFILRYRLSIVKKPGFYLYFLVSLLPFLAWRMFIARYPEGIPSSDWLITSVNTFEGQRTIFMKPAFFRWIFYERINIMIFGGFITPLFVAGIFTKAGKYFLHSILLAAFAYLFVFQGGNVQHEYYQILIMAPLAIFAGIGASMFVTQRKQFITPFITVPVIMFFIALSTMFSYYYKVKDFYTYPADLNHMARILQTFTDPQDKVITDRMGDTTLLYMSDRKGAPMLYKTIEQLKDDGYSYYMTDKKEIIADLKTDNEYPLLFENNQFALFRL